MKTEKEVWKEFEIEWRKWYPSINHKENCMCIKCIMESGEKPIAALWWLKAWKRYGKERK